MIVKVHLSKKVTEYLYIKIDIALTRFYVQIHDTDILISSSCDIHYLFPLKNGDQKYNSK